MPHIKSKGSNRVANGFLGPQAKEYHYFRITNPVTQRPSPEGGQPLIRHYMYKITKWPASTLHKSSWFTLTTTTIHYFIHHSSSSLSELILNCFTALRSLLTLRYLLFFHYITWMSEYGRQPPLALLRKLTVYKRELHI